MIALCENIHACRVVLLTTDLIQKACQHPNAMPLFISFVIARLNQTGCQHLHLEHESDNILSRVYQGKQDTILSSAAELVYQALYGAQLLHTRALSRCWCTCVRML